MTRAEFEARLIAKAYQDKDFRHQLLKDPKGVLVRELAQLKGEIVFPAHFKVNVMEESDEQIYLVIPPQPQFDTDGLSEEQIREGGSHPSGGHYYVSMFMPGAPMDFGEPTPPAQEESL